jgi:sugar phosphate isomerase/epimerase
MPRLGVITDELSEDLDHALAVCKELDIHVVELRSIWGTSIVDLADDQIARLETSLRDGGFSVAAIASPYLKCHLEEDKTVPAGPLHSAGQAPRSRQGEILERSLDLADRLDAPIVRAFSFWRLPDPIAARQEIRDVLQEATATVAKRGKLLGLENEHSCNIGTGGEAAWYLERIPDRTFGLIWDPGNEAALGSVPYPGGYEAVRERIHHVHLKDAAYISTETGFVRIGDGAIAYEDQFRAFVDDAYAGVLSLETHYRLDGDREAASRACISGIREIAALANLPLT